MNLFTPVSQIPGVGVSYKNKLEYLGISTVKDFLFYFPRAYDDQSNIKKINEMRTDESNTIRVTLNQIKNQRTRRGKVITKAIASDDTGIIEVVWFNQPFLNRSLKPNMEVILSGKIKFAFGRITMQSPVFENIKDQQLHTARIVPIYHETEGISSKWIRYKMKDLLYLAETIEEFLPQKWIKEYNFLSLSEAIKQAHFPDNQEILKRARERLGFNELFIIQLNSLTQKIIWQKNVTNFKNQIPLNKKLIQEFLELLPFKLTDAQKISAYEILKDMEKNVPMLRLLEGDVGSGKTVVATIAVLNAIKAGFQTTIMAPTEILAVQHFKGITPLLAKFNINVQFLAGSTTAKRKKEIYSGIATGVIDLVIGTHALIQKDIHFKNLGLAVIDEQHRFGVKQRNILQKQGNPHLLNMTATPIPRSLALTIYGDQDISIIGELPPGRKKIITRAVTPTNRNTAYLFIEDQVKKGQQIFVICPLVDESDFFEVKSAIQEHKRLQEEVFPNLKVGLLHGKMKQKEKDAVMLKFQNNEINILVSTSVIEVGIDVPNATIMLIEGAERFGLAQLHQFRGRVGRGKHQSYCLLFTDGSSENVKNRMKAMVKHDNGFKLAEIDLQMRGPGEVFGVKQSGIPDLKMASLTDQDLIYKTRQRAEELLEQDPELEKHERIKRVLQEYQRVSG